MTSLDYRLNPMYVIKECSSCGALYNKSCGCSKGGFVDKFVRDPNETPDPSQRPPHDCPKCGNPVDGLYCRQCALLRKKLKEDPSENSSQSPSHIDHHYCYGCGDSLDGCFGNKQYKPEDIQELIQKLFHDVQNIHKELAEYINTLIWNHPACSNYDDDDEDYTIAITPVLSTEEPIDTLIMEDEHLDTILVTELDEVIKSSVEDLVPIPSESEGIPDNMCDVPFRDNSPPLDILKDQLEDFSNSNDDSTSSDDDYFSINDIDYVESSPPDFELVSLEEVKDDILSEKLLNIHLLIDKIESLNVNPTPDRVLKSPFPFPIPVKDSNSLFKKSDTSLSYLDNSLPEFETFSDHMEETSSGGTTTHADKSLLKYDSFLFDIEPDHGKLTSFLMEDNLGEPRVHVPNVLPTHPTLMLDSDFIPFDNSLLESEIFCFDIEEKNNGSTTSHADISLPFLIISISRLNLIRDCPNFEDSCS
nr:hypothetical protein [Tanacetum cinerariifolium]